MLTYCILNAYFQYRKYLLTSFLMPTYNFLKNIKWVSPIKDSLSKKLSLIKICVKNNMDEFNEIN